MFSWKARAKCRWAPRRVSTTEDDADYISLVWSLQEDFLPNTQHCNRWKPTLSNSSKIDGTFQSGKMWCDGVTNLCLQRPCVILCSLEDAFSFWAVKKSGTTHNWWQVVFYEICGVTVFMTAMGGGDHGWQGWPCEICVFRKMTSLSSLLGKDWIRSSEVLLPQRC